MDYVNIVVVWLAGIMIGIGVGADLGKGKGRIQVASGQYECTLETQADKTTSWKCEEVK